LAFFLLIRGCVNYDKEFSLKITLLLLLSITLVSCGQGPHTDANDSKDVTLTENLVANCSVTKDANTLEVVISCPDGTEERIKDGVDGQDGTSCTIEDKVGGAMISCGDTKAFIKDGTDGQDGSACSVKEAQNGSGSLISCADGTSAFIKNGRDGDDGSDGQDGQDGDDGSDGQDGQDGSDGQNGEDGDDGSDGQDGQDGSDGQNGQDGADGQDGLDFVQRVIDPCGQQSTQGFDEVLLVLQSGDILAHFDNGDDQFLTILKRKQSYVTSDGTGCHFSVTKDGEVEY
jgi:hypothetical protein